MKITLSVVSGPHQGREFLFDSRDTFLVGRSKDAHFQLSFDDPYFSRRHFLLEVNPPRCRLIDLNSRNGTSLNGSRARMAEVKDGDEIRAGHTVFKVRVVPDDPDERVTLDLPDGSAPGNLTTDFLPLPAAIPEYRIECELGRGGVGVVHRATRVRDGLSVAIKTILPAPGTGPRQIARFLRECRILAGLTHPNIVSFLECGEAGGVVYLIMDLLEGPDLDARLAAGGPEDVRTAVRMTCQMLAGLAHAHSKGFVHRDIKPANVLLGRQGAKRLVKIADFGLARAYETSEISGLTMQGEVGGTPAFMAPEQATHYREVKPAADQYSAAATLYKMLTKSTPHDLPKDLGAQIAHIVTAAPVPIRDRMPELPAGLAAVIDKALSREPEDRYPDVAALRQELKRFG